MPTLKKEFDKEQMQRLVRQKTGAGNKWSFLVFFVKNFEQSGKAVLEEASRVFPNIPEKYKEVALNKMRNALTEAGHPTAALDALKSSEDRKSVQAATDATSSVGLFASTGVLPVDVDMTNTP